MKKGSVNNSSSVGNTKNKPTEALNIPNGTSIGTMRITFYAGDGITANGTKPIPYITCAAGSGIPFETKIFVPSIGILTVTDRGNPNIVTDNVLDVFVSGTEAETNDLGARYENCYIVD